MKTAIFQAIQLIFFDNSQLWNIIAVTLKMGLCSSSISLALGVPLGILLGSSSNRAKNIFIVLNRTLMGIPPVVCGLVFYMLFSGVGPLRHLKLLYTVGGMIIAQVALITPLIIGNLESHVSTIAPNIMETSIGMGLGRIRTLKLIVNESQYQILSAYLFGLGRSFAEVGAISMVGGAIAYKTNVITTAIMNYSNRGDITLALALGIILMVISFVINSVATLIFIHLK